VEVLPYFSSDNPLLVIRRAFFLTVVQDSSRVSDLQTGNVTHIAGGRSKAAHSKDQRYQTVARHFL